MTIKVYQSKEDKYIDMKVLARYKYVGETNELRFINGKIYNCVGYDEEHELARIVDETDEDYLYSLDDFEIVSEHKNIPTPCKLEVKKYLNKWDSLENYVLQENSLYKLFHKTYPNNTDINDILIKASSLNDFYSTNIFSIFPVAKHILELNIDKRLKTGDITLVNDISKVTIGGVEKHFYSFATKYCSHHNADDFPIYDSYVEKVLIYFKTQDKFDIFTSSELKDYNKFKNILINFRKYYNIDNYSLKDIDRYLWQLGKEYFPKKY